MLKKFLCGAAVLTFLSGSMTTPSQAEELYVRNRLFRDAYFMGSTTYVPVDVFLRAVEVPWTVDDGVLVLGQGESPEWVPSNDNLVAMRGGEKLDLQGVLRGGRLYVPAKDLAEFVGYGVIYNRDTGIVDVVKGRMTTAADKKAAEEVRSAREAEEAERDAAWQARVEKARAARKAKEEAAKEGDDGEEVASAEEGDGEDVKDTPAPKVDGEEDEELESYEADSTDTDAEDVKEEGPPPEADLVVLSTEANPNNYTGEVVFRAVLQNQGNATATDVLANFKVVGPDEKTWIDRRMYHADIKPDGRWEIVENYKHRLGGAIPRGNYNVTVTPTFKSQAPEK